MFNLTIHYYNGRGAYEIDLDMFLPATQHDFSVFIRILKDANTADRAPEKCYEYIRDQIANLQEKRGKLDPVVMKSTIANINDKIKKYIKNAAELHNVFDTPVLSDADAEIKLVKSVVYSFGNYNGPSTIKTFDGFTFEKSGLQFDAYPEKFDRRTYYHILLHGTGLQVITCNKKKEIITSLTPDVIKKLKNVSAEKMQEYEDQFKKAMVKAGYMEPAADQTENKEHAAADPEHETMEPAADPEPAEHETDPERETMDQTENNGGKKDMLIAGIEHKAEYKKDEIIIDGIAYRAEYRRETSGDIYITRYTKNVCITSMVKTDNPDYTAAAAACETPAENNSATDQDNMPAEDPGTPAADNTPAEYASETMEPGTPAAREKTFIGSRIKGRAWAIYFDGDLQKTRVILSSNAPADLIEAVKNAGFYYSSATGSYHKKLTFKAYRAALQLADTLKAMEAAAA